MKKFLGKIYFLLKQLLSKKFAIILMWAGIFYLFSFLVVGTRPITEDEIILLKMSFILLITGILLYGIHSLLSVFKKYIKII